MITVRDLVHEFDGERVLDGVSLTIADGEWVVLAGPNGSGKTTLVRHFNALLESDGGEVQIGGVPAAENPVRARTSVGMVFQSPRDQFVAATVGADVAFGPENLGLDHDEIDRRVAEALGAVNMADREEERIDELSGGEQARVAIAGALAMEPDHLVLDEPFTGLDWPARRSALQRLDTLAADGTGIVFVTHDVRDVLDRADRVVGLESGTVAFDLPPDDARERLAEIDVRVPGPGAG
ncbi:ABC transporter ATP-binding protein [Halobacteriales archaeon QH_7_66_37]|jgi:biotin transport system ATP-binding protein|nr:MAG: ABC transporter ATP-binding protein [Halobacteriales archaeon QH_7_66_37]